MMNFQVRDTKNPNKEPFYISKLGYEGLKAKFGSRYVPVDGVVIHEEVKVIKVPTIEVTEKGVKKTAKSKGQG